MCQYFSDISSILVSGFELINIELSKLYLCHLLQLKKKKKSFLHLSILATTEIQ